MILPQGSQNEENVGVGARNDDENDSSAKTIDLNPRGDQSVSFS